jgi:CrcB protein
VTWFLIALGGAIGAPGRYLLDGFISSRSRARFPTGTLVINVLGSAVLGALAAATTRTGHVYAALGTGFCGAFTTFSTFAWESVALAEDGGPRLAVANIGLSLALAVSAASLTYWLW